MLAKMTRAQKRLGISIEVVNYCKLFRGFAVELYMKADTTNSIIRHGRTRSFGAAAASLLTKAWMKRQSTRGMVN